MAGSNTGNPNGRPTKMTEATVNKLLEAFAYDSTVEEACYYADISRETYYNYAEKTAGFNDKVSALRQRPVLAARQKVIKAIEEDPKHAQWYLERKRKVEFATRTESEATVIADVTSNGQTIGDPALAAGFADYLKTSTGTAKSDAARPVENPPT